MHTQKVKGALMWNLNILFSYDDEDIGDFQICISVTLR